MATLTVRNLPDEALSKFRIKAARNGRSMEAEARDLIVAIADGAELSAAPVALSFDERVDRAQAMIRAELGELPKGRVDAFIAERKAAAGRGE